MAGHLSFPLIFSDVGGGGSGLPAGGTDGQILLSDGAGSGTWADGAVGRTKVVSVPFAFDTPDLLTGAVIYTPTVGELLLDGWIEIVTAWDGTTPHADIGTFLNGSTSGLFRRADSAIPADAIDDDTDNPGILVGTNSLAYSLAEKSVYGDIQRSAPAKFTVANPLCVIVTQEGTPGGTSPGAGQGAAIVHLVIWSPDEVGGVTGGLSVTDGSTTVSPVTSLTVTGATVSGSAGNATIAGFVPSSNYITIPGALESTSLVVNPGGVGKTFYSSHELTSVGEGAFSLAAQDYNGLTHTFNVGAAGDITALVLNADGSITLPGLSAALAAQGIGALSLYGDGSDGTVTVDGDAINFPTLAGIDDWAAATPYAVGDLVKSTGSHVRIFECIAAGVSGSEDPCPDTAPGNAMCGNRFFDTGINPTPVWEQVTKIIANTVEGPIFATTMTVASTRTLVDHGWPLYARTEFILDGSLSSAGFAATAAVPVDLTIFLGVQTLLGRGVAGVAPILGDTAGGNAGATWGGGMGGYGGSGDDGAAAAMGNKFGTDAPGFSLARRMISTLFAAYYYGLDPEAALGTIGSSGGAGRCAAIAPDFDTGPLGGASGSAGSGVAILANRLTLNGSISSVGGDGGDAEQSGNTGGGGGGSGGCCVLVYGIKTGAGTVDVSGGAGGIGHGTGTAGTDGSPGDLVEFANA